MGISFSVFKIGLGQWEVSLKNAWYSKKRDWHLTCGARAQLGTCERSQKLRKFRLAREILVQHGKEPLQLSGACFVNAVFWQILKILPNSQYANLIKFFFSYLHRSCSKDRENAKHWPNRQRNRWQTIKNRLSCPMFLVLPNPVLVSEVSDFWSYSLAILVTFGDPPSFLHWEKKNKTIITKL